MEKQELTWIMEIPKPTNRFVYSVLYNEYIETTQGELARFMKYPRTTCGDILRRLVQMKWVTSRKEHRTTRGRPKTFFKALTPEEREILIRKEENNYE
jgi:DNA-binding MarR family transcriptional regulator